MAQFLGNANAQHARQLLRARGFQFCDDDDARVRQLSSLYEPLQQAWLREASSYRSLIRQPVLASTTDHLTQSIGNTRLDDRTFWSSGPSASEDATESLIYQLAAPLCVVKFVYLAVYREFHQHGAPLYPPLELSMGIGTTFSNISTVTPRFPVPLDDRLHLYPIPASACPGMFLRLEFHGKQQLQREDMQYYIAIRYVDAVGESLPTPEAVAAVKQLLSTQQNALPLLHGPRLADVQHHLDGSALLAAAQQDQQPGSSLFRQEGDLAPSASKTAGSSFLQKIQGIIGGHAANKPHGETPSSAAAPAAHAANSRLPSQQPQTRQATGTVEVVQTIPAAWEASGEHWAPLTGPGMVIRWGLHDSNTRCDWQVDCGYEQWQYDEDWDEVLAA